MFCTKDAGIPIKAYSPELIVHPSLPTQIDIDKDIRLNKIKTWLKSMHGFVIGPGLGREEFLGDFLYDLLTTTIEKQITVLDADGLWHLIKNEKLLALISKRKGVILTPNVGEFERLWEKIMDGKGESLFLFDI